MKKILSLIAIMFVALCASAQDPQKETVIVDHFYYLTSVVDGSEVANGIRDAFVQGFTQKGRFNVVDALKDATLQSFNEKRKSNTEENVDASNVLDAESAEIYKSLGAKFIVQAQVTSINNNYVKKALSDSYNWQSEITVSLTIYNIVDGSIHASEQMRIMGWDDERAALAQSSAVRGASDDVKKLVDKYFPFTTHIEQIEKSHEKKGAQELYIVGGTEMGVQKGQTFVVKLVKQIGSRTTQVEIGKLKAKEVMDGLTLCTVTKGGKEIAAAYKESGDLSKFVVISDKMAWGSDIVNMFK